jgi:DNA polymerase elongation subunit (family B)
MKVVYGHTDSIYVQIDSVEKAEEAIKEIESSVREHFPNVMGLEQHPVVLEFEKYYSALGVGTTKNRNAGMITWKDGEWLDEPEFVMTGFTAKRVSETKLAKEVQTEVLKWWVSQETLEQINSKLSNTFKDVLNGNYPIENVIKRSRLREDRFTVKCPQCRTKYDLRQIEELEYCKKCSVSPSKFRTLEDRRPSIGSGIAGVIFACQNNQNNFDDSYLYLKVISKNTFVHPLTKEVKQVTYISGSNYKDFSNCSPDWKHYSEQVVKKAEPIYRAMDWDISNIRTGTIQKTLGDWF